MDLFTIHTYGYGHLIFQVLQGIAKFRVSGLFDSIVLFTTFAVGMYYAVMMANSHAPEGWKIWLRKALLMIVFVQVALLPTVSMYVKDHVAKTPPRKVDNIPLAFALPVGTMEQWGYILTISFEQAFQWVGGGRTKTYSTHGSIFGVRIADDLRKLNFKDPEVVANVTDFIDQCIILRAGIGYPFTPEEIKASKDVWALVAERTHGVVTQWTKYENGKRRLQNCTQGVQYVDSKLRDEGNDILSVLMKKYKYGPTRKNEFLQDIASVFDPESATASRAARIITHNMMLNAMENLYIDATPDSYGAARAKIQYEATSLMSGSLASQLMTGTSTLFRVIVYSSFLLVLPLLIISGGKLVRGYTLAVFSLAIWPALFTIINMVIDYSYDVTEIVTFASLASAENKYDSINAVASGMYVVVPFLAFWITKMGEGGIMHMAGSILSAMQQSAGSAGSMIESGNISTAVINKDIESRNNTSSNKHNQNFESFGGASTVNLADGEMFSRTGSGNTIISSGDGLTHSKFGSNINMRDDMQETVTTALNTEQANHESISSSLDKGLGHQEQNIDNYIKSLAKRVDAGGKVNWSAAGKDSEALQKAVFHELRTGEEYNHRTEESAGMALKASFGGDIPFTKIGGSVEGSLGVQDVSSQGNMINITDTENEHWSKNFDSVYEASQNTDFNQSWGADNSLTQDIHQTQSQNIDWRCQEQLSSDRIQSLQKRSEDIRSFGSNYDVSATHMVADKLIDDGMDALKVQKLIDNPHNASHEDRYKLNQARSKVRDELMDSISGVGSRDKASEFIADSLGHQRKMNDLDYSAQRQINAANKESTQKIQQLASNEGVSPEQIKTKHNDTERVINTNAQDLNNRNSNALAKQEAENRQRLEESKKLAESKQPAERAKNAGNYILNKLTPPKDRK